jgi:hypothetical protein
MSFCYVIFVSMKEIPSKFTLGEKEIPFGEIYNKFSSTKYGDTLKKNVRYEPYKPTEVPNKTWERLLGGDVNNLTHLTVSRGLTLGFLKSCDNPGKEWEGKVSEEARFTPQEQKMLLLTATVHDWGEAIIGDIPYLLKQKSDEEREMVELKKLINNVFGEDNKKESNIVADQVTNILSDTTTKLGKAFNAIEQVGYVRTGIRAYEKSKNENGQLKDNLEYLGCKVVPHQMQALLEYSEIYPPVRAFINHHKNTISDIFETGERNPKYKNVDGFEGARQAWLSKIS